MIELGVVADQETVTDSQINRGLYRLRLLLESWALDDLLAYNLFHTSHSVVGAGKQKYSLGLDGASDIAIEPPRKIQLLNYKRNGYDEPRPMERVNYKRYSERSDSDGTWPSSYYYENSFPVGYLYFNTPTVPGDFFEIVHATSLLGVDPMHPEKDDEVVYPQGYERAILCNLALELAPSYGLQSRDMNPVTIKAATDGLSMIRSFNLDQPTSSFKEFARMSGGITGHVRTLGYGYGRR